jgi:hypothetical protein
MPVRHDHHHGPVRRARAAAPTLSLLRLSAAVRVAGAAVLAVAVWALVLLTIG